MWIKKGAPTISERPDEEDEVESNNEETIQNENKVNKLLNIHKHENNDNNFFLDNNKKINGKKKLLDDNDKENNKYNNWIRDNHSFSEKRVLEKRVELFPEKNQKNKNSTQNNKSQANSYRFIRIEEHNILNTEEFPVIKLEETKETNLRKRSQNNEIFNREEIEKFNSIKSVTNSEKMRHYIRYKEAWNYFSSHDFTKEKKLIKVEDFSKYNCIYKMYLNCLKKLTLNNELLDEREQVFAIAKISLNYSDEYHMRMLNTIYKNLTQEVECPMKGYHYMKIGFQNDDPSTDLRGNGMFSILQTLSFIDNLNTFAKEIYNFSLNENFNFPLMCTLINLSSFSLEALREGNLVIYCNLNNSIISTLNDYFFGLIDHFFTIYKNSNQTLDYVNSLLEQVNDYAKKNSDQIFILASNVKLKYPATLIDSMSLGDDNHIE